MSGPLARAHYPAGDCPLGWGMAIHRRLPSTQWRAALLQVPEPLRLAAERYLRDIARRQKVADNLRQQREAAEQKRGRR